MADDPFEENLPAEEQLVPPLREADEPMSLPDDVPSVEDTHQATDSNIDSDEAYHEGLSEATEASDPDPNNSA
jgi:hypothetical protein